MNIAKNFTNTSKEFLVGIFSLALLVSVGWLFYYFAIFLLLFLSLVLCFLICIMMGKAFLGIWKNGLTKTLNDICYVLFYG